MIRVTTLTWNDYFTVVHTKNNYTSFRSSPHALALTSHLLYSFSSHLSSSRCLLHLLCTRLRLLASRLCFCFSAWAFLSCLCISGLHVYITCMLCILPPLPYMLPYCTCTLLISCFVAPCTYFISYITLLLCTCTAYF